jgi:threonylcarbamoyladenosine tRNA methylthiotransferase CDKAL1
MASGGNAHPAQDTLAGEPTRAKVEPPLEPRPLRVHFQTHGCTTNFGDTRIMQGIMQSKGHQVTDDPEEADLLVLNTCTVVQTTDQNMQNTLRAWNEKGKPIIAAGCMAATQQEAILEAAPEARLLAPRHLHHIEQLATGREHTPEYRPKSGLPRAQGLDAIIPLAEGCLFSCSYCLTKSARGTQTSYPLEELVADIREAIAQGAVEIKLTSQDTSGYGNDTGTDLAQLLSCITKIGGEHRVRAGMMHPRTAHRILPRLLDAMDHPKVYKFLHLPIQSGSPRILKAMRRGHPLEEFWQVVEAFRERFPKGVVSTDIIIGFPGETDDDHQATLELLRRLQAEHVNITRFSPRPGTDAPRLEGRVPTQVAKARSREATRLVLDLMAAKNQKRIGETVEVTVVEPGKKENSVLGRGPAYEPIALASAEPVIPLGSRLTATIVQAEPTYLIAEAASRPRMVSKRPPQPPRSSRPSLPSLRVL